MRLFVFGNQKHQNHSYAILLWLLLHLQVHKIWWETIGNVCVTLFIHLHPAEHHHKHHHSPNKGKKEDAKIFIILKRIFNRFSPFFILQNIELIFTSQMKSIDFLQFIFFVFTNSSSSFIFHRFFLHLPLDSSYSITSVHKSNRNHHLPFFLFSLHHRLFRIFWTT